MFDVEECRNLLELKGFRVLPVGTVIEIGYASNDPAVVFNVVVCGIRLRAGSPDTPTTLQLDVVKIPVVGDTELWAEAVRKVREAFPRDATAKMAGNASK